MTHLQIVGSVDAQSHLLTGDLPTPSSWAASLVRTRRVHVQRSWRQEIDGTYVVMFSSVSGHRGGGGEVEVPYYACGYTVAPVRERCLKKGHIRRVALGMLADGGHIRRVGLAGRVQWVSCRRCGVHLVPARAVACGMRPLHPVPRISVAAPTSLLAPCSQ